MIKYLRLKFFTYFSPVFRIQNYVCGATVSSIHTGQAEIRELKLQAC